MDDPIATLVWFYNQRAGAENLMKEANNDAGLAAHPSGRWATNCVHFQLVMLAYNLNCWLLLSNRAEAAKTDDLKHTTLAMARLRFRFVAAKIWRHAGRVGISYSDQYQERGFVPAAHESTPRHHGGPNRIPAGARYAAVRLKRA
jgi:Transposase DDE domain group 1